MKRIVVGTDLGSRSKGAVEMAARLAGEKDSVVHLVTACPPPAAALAVHEALVAMPATEETIGAATAELKAMAEDLRRRDVSCEIHVVTGAAAEALCEVAETVDADLIVVGNYRMQGVGRVLGSVANRVAHHAPCSVLIARTS